MGCANCNSLKNKKSGCKNSNHCERCNKFSVFDWLSNISPVSNEKGCNIVEVSFKNGRKKYYHNKNITIKKGDPVVVKCDFGYDIGIISLRGELVALQLNRKQIKDSDIGDIVRPASQIDLNQWHDSIKLEKGTMLETRKIVKSLNLNMKVSDVEYQADSKKAIFYYLSEKRVDFRELIKVLTHRFKIKVLLRQVGARQESKIIGGLGSCGRELCCASWLTDQRSVSISAARYQKLSLNPQKLTGQCGKLKCCLNYELANYMEALKDFPNTRVLIKTKKGAASVQKIDIFKKIIWYGYVGSNQDWMPIRLAYVKKMLNLNKKGDADFILEDFMLNN